MTSCAPPTPSSRWDGATPVPCPGKRYLNWQLADPTGLDREGLRAVRDEIRRHVEDLLSELNPMAPAAAP